MGDCENYFVVGFLCGQFGGVVMTLIAARIARKLLGETNAD